MKAGKDKTTPSREGVLIQTIKSSIQVESTTVKKSLSSCREATRLVPILSVQFGSVPLLFQSCFIMWRGNI